MIESDDPRSVYTGNGVATTFAYGFPVSNKNFMIVTKVLISDESETTLVVDTDYTVNGVGSDDDSDWDITLPVSGSPLSSLYRLVIIPNLPLLQSTDFENQGGFLADTHEAAFDYLTVTQQQQKEEIDRSVKVPIGSTIDPDDLISDLSADADAAAVSAAAASSSASSASTFASNASTSATNASISEANAAASAAAAVGISIDAQTGTTYTILAADKGKLVTFSNGSPVAVTLPIASSFTSPFWFYTENKGAGAATITPTTSTINGASTLVLAQNQGVLVVSDGTNYQILRGKAANVSLTADVIGTLPIANGGTGLTAVGSALQVLRTNAGATAFESATLSLGGDILIVAEQQASGASGATATAGSWQTKVLNTEIYDSASLGTLSSNVISLVAGTYRVFGSTEFFSCNNSQSRLRNTSDSVTLVNGSSNYGASSGSTSTLFGRFTIAATKNIELQYFVATNGPLGQPTTSAEVETYSKLIFIKE